MNREPRMCSTCSRFVRGRCVEFDRPASGGDRAGIFYLERGSYEAAKAARTSAAILAELHQRGDRKKQ